MPALQFWQSGGDVFTTGSVVVDEHDAQALLAVFEAERVSAQKAGKHDMAHHWAQVIAQLCNARAAQRLWVRASGSDQARAA